VVFDTTIKDKKRGSSAPSPTCSIRVLVRGGAPVREPQIALRAGTTKIGRAVGKKGVALEDDRVSREHALIEVEASGAALLRDTSSNGTEVNGEITAARELADGDLVVLGESALLFRRGPSEPDDEEVPSYDLIGDAPAIRALRRAIRQIGPSGATVLLHGETGTGKELAARALHTASRRPGELVPVNCSAIPAPLAEAQLFGHLAGSYTGARTPGTGVIRAADGGTLFLDELADLPLEIQPKLLRVLEDRLVAPVGATKGAPVDLRVVAATHVDLLEAVEAGRFRADLYARLSDFVLELPPLRERREDILPILLWVLGDDAPPLAPELWRALLLYDWPFNVRELRKVATQLKVVGEGVAQLELSLLGGRLGGSNARTRSTAPPSNAPAPTPTPARAREPAPRIDVAPDRETLAALLTKHRGVVADIAREVGRSRKQVYRWIEQHGLPLDRYRGE
jgi:DNA-binding NtrC family response regulator